MIPQLNLHSLVLALFHVQQTSPSLAPGNAVLQRPPVPASHLREMHSPAPPCHLPSEAYAPDTQTYQGRPGYVEGERAGCVSSGSHPSPLETATCKVRVPGWTLTLSLAIPEECMVRRLHCTSQCRNHLQTMPAPVLAEEEDLLGGWIENKEQLCKLYGATLWEMPFRFPLVNVPDIVSKGNWALLPNWVQTHPQHSLPG